MYRSAGTSALMFIIAFVFMTQAVATEVEVSATGDVAIPAFTLPSSAIMSKAGNDSRVEHIVTERMLKGKTTAEVNAALFGPRLERTRKMFDVSIRNERIGGVNVLVYEPRAGVAQENRDKLLLNLHGGGFVGCFVECGGLESMPVAARTGIRVISIDYRLAPAARFPAASEDVASVYREVLRSYGPGKIGLYGCSAGGSLTAQSLAWFQSHDLPSPAAAGIFCAGADSRMGGDSRILGNLLGDGEMPESAPGASRIGYMSAAARTDPNAFPAESKSVLAKFPPTLVIAGLRDFALSAAVRLHGDLVAQGVDARLHLWEGGRHAFFYDARVPESLEAYDVMAKFFVHRLGGQIEVLER